MNFSFLIIILLITLVFSCRKLELNNTSILLFVLMLLVLYEFYLYKGKTKTESFNNRIPMSVTSLRNLRNKLQEVVNINKSNNLKKVRNNIENIRKKIKSRN